MRKRLAQAGLLTIVAVVVLGALVQAQTQSITTTYESNAGFTGNMFDVTATNTVTLLSFDIHVSRAEPETVSIYYKSGSYVGHETNPGSWTPLGTSTVNGAGRGFPTPVNIGGLVIPAGETYGLYITLGSNNLENTNAAGTYSDANLTLNLGAGLSGLFGASNVHSPRTWNGTIYYETENAPPVAVDDSGTGYGTDEDTAFTTASVLPNDSDPDGDTLSLDDVDTTGLAGSLTDNGNGTFGYDPNGMFEYLGLGDNTTDVFTYTVGDGRGGADTATVTIAIAGVNDAPVAVDDNGAGYETDEDTAFTTANVLPNDSDAEGDTLGVVAVDTAGLVGNLTDNGDGSFDYDPNGMFESLGVGASTTDVFTYTISDTHGLTDTATVTLSIAGVNDAPVAVDDSGAGYETDEDTAFTTASVLDNDSDPDGETLTLDSVETTGLVGDLTDNGDGTFGYDPNGQFEALGLGESDIDIFTYTISDTHGLTDTAAVTITIHGANHPPVAVDDLGWGFVTNEDTLLPTGSVLLNDGDPDGDSVAVQSFDDTGTLGVLTDNGNGTFLYDPDGQFEGLSGVESATDLFTYIISDTHGLTDTATVSITVNGANDPPLAEDDEYMTPFETPLTVPVEDGVLDNDTDAEDDLLTAVLDSGPDGDLVFAADGSFVYTPTTGYRGADTFTYHAFDGLAASNVATVTINVLNSTDVDLEMEKVVSAETPIEGDTVVYTLTVTNDGPADATGIVITDTLPPGVTYVADDGDGDYDGARWDAGDLDNNTIAILHITVTVDAATTGMTITNTAVISASDQEDPVGGNDEAQAAITVVDPQADLELSKDVDDTMPDEQGTIVYTLVVTNHGPRDATGVEISDTLPSGVTYVADDGSGSYDGTTWAMGDLSAELSATLRITAAVDAETLGTTITNTAVISALDQVDPVDSNDEAQAAITVVEPQADLELSKDVDNTTPDETGTIVYTLTIINNGPRDATGVKISDTLPSGITYVDDDGGGDYDGMTWAVGDLGATVSATLHITATADVGTAGSIITNTAVISALDQGDPDLDNNDAQAVIEAQEPADVDPPIVTAVSPEDGATGVPVGEDVVVTFNEAIDAATFTYAVVPDPGGAIETWNGAMTQVTLSHDDFDRLKVIDVTVTGAEDLAGNAMADPYTWSFTTESYWQFLPLVASGWTHTANRR